MPSATKAKTKALASILDSDRAGGRLTDAAPAINLVAVDVAEMRETYANCLVTPADKRELRFVRSFIDVASEVLGV
jgi:hypothetical protein